MDFQRQADDFLPRATRGGGGGAQRGGGVGGNGLGEGLLDF